MANADFQYKVYEGDLIFGVGRPILITAAIRNFRKVVGESILIVVNSQTRRFEVLLHRGVFPLDFTAGNDDDVIKSVQAVLLDEGKLMMNNLQEKQFSVDHNFALTKECRFRDADPAILEHLWRRGLGHQDDYAKIIGSTYCATLKSYLIEMQANERLSFGPAQLG